ncbi:MAG: hypothetical protein COA57_01100 [Flavobacteriales bacterium]|nr:MAG: hypothetical protein COA57_01100 [Flavobacteriales bacterium]
MEAVKSAVLLRRGSTFLALKPKKQWLDIEFMLKDKMDEFPVYKTFRLSKNRVAHYVRIESPKEVDRQLLNWLKEAYEVVG